VTYFESLSRHLYWETEERYGKPVRILRVGGRDLHRTPPEYKPEALPLEPACSVSGLKWESV
jgi:hypothetical protein